MSAPRRSDERDDELGLEAGGLGRAGGVGELGVGAVDVVGEVDREADRRRRGR
jgi:hypothetical protein